MNEWTPVKVTSTSGSETTYFSCPTCRSLFLVAVEHDCEESLRLMRPLTPAEGDAWAAVTPSVPVSEEEIQRMVANSIQAFDAGEAAEDRREEIRKLHAEVVGSRPCKRCGGQMAHYRLKGYRCFSCD